MPEGEWKVKDGIWYKAIFKKEWERHILRQCRQCGNEFLTRHNSLTCSKKCSANYRWSRTTKNERNRTDVYVRPEGYVFIRDSDGKWIAEHRKIMADFIGRELNPSESVHHINGVRGDNNIDNLMLVSRSEHNILHKSEESSKRKRDENGRFIPAAG